MAVDLFQKVITLLNAIVPVFCLTGLLGGAVLAWRQNHWGYYIMLVSALGLVARAYILR
ncbi:MAG TPA: hypothetical protein VI749_03315 [Candidatus Omnitrophota bacterium]|nr:hypothetical protein [Candidatus Omnitrophota bacterium]